jgi:hypothetical protein
MPVEIKELVIRAVVTQQPGEDSPEASSPGEDSDRQTIVEECVRQVLRVLKNSKER